MSIVPPTGGFGGADARPTPPGAPQPKGTVGGQPTLGRLGRLEDKLYSPSANVDVRRRRPLHPTRGAPVPPGWAGSDQSLSSDEYVESIRQKPQSPFLKVLLVALVFFVGALGYAGWKLYGGGSLAVSEGSEDVRITVAGPNEAPGGDAFYFDVVVQNGSPVPLELANLLVDFPNGTKDPETKAADQNQVRLPLGDVEPGATVRKTVGATLYGKEGEAKRIDVSVQYRSAGTSAIFEKRRTYDVALAESPVRLTVDALDRVTSGQAMPLEIRVSSNAPSRIENLALLATLPFGYAPSSYSVAPTQNGFWSLGALEPGEEKVVRIEGVLEGSDGDQRTFKFRVGQAATSGPAVAVDYSSQAVTVAIEKPFLGLSLAINGDPKPTVAREATRQMDSLLTLVNNTDAPIRDAVVTLRFTGGALERESVLAPFGAYRSATNVVRWDKTTAPELESISPGKNVILALSFRSLPLVDGSASPFRQPEIVLDLEGVGRRVAEDGVSEEIKTLAARRVRLVSDVSIEGSLAHVSGPRPPKVDQATVYRVTLTARNSSSDVANAAVTAVLPPEITWLGQRGGDGTATYSEANRTLSWAIGDIFAGSGYASPAASVSFDAELVPNVNQVESYPTIVGQPTITGEDVFSGAKINVTGLSVQTERGDNVSQSPGRVVR